MRDILLTWNPGPRNDEQWSPESWDVEMVTGEAADYQARWSVGNRKQGIQPGDRAYLHRQGRFGRGLVAVGVIDSAPYEADSWRGDGTLTNYVNVTWEEALALDDRLDIKELKAATPGFNWDSIYGSGRDVTEIGSKLTELWGDRASDATVLPRVVRGAGFGTAEQNRKVERAAVGLVTKSFSAQGYQVTSVEDQRCGWDLTATRGDGERHIEVKGVAGSLPRFFLTSNEHRAALNDPAWVLVVVTDALGEPSMHQTNGPTVTTVATPALYQVRIPAELLT